MISQKLFFSKNIHSHFSLFSRNIEFSDALENFILSSVSTILVVRLFLSLTGYPQLGGGGLHIAHMLWGGLLLTLSLLMSISFLNKEARRLSIIIGGIGFGLFIDEIGKFVTSDNNYFFQPTFALIYMVFIAVFFSFRWIMSHTPLTSSEYAMNAIEEMKEILYLDLDEDEKQKTLLYLQKSDSHNPLVSALHKTLMNLSPHTQERDLSLFGHMKKNIREVYGKWGRQAKIARLIATIFIGLSIFRFLTAISGIEWEWDFWEWGRQFSSGLVCIWILKGIYAHKKGLRLQALKHYQRGVVISILLVQLFDFYHDQLSAIVGLLFSLLSYVTLEYLIEEERIGRLQKKPVFEI